MKQHIQNFPSYLLSWYELWKEIDLSWIISYDSIVFVGMWWSAMALSVIKWLVDRSHRSIPSQVVKEYHVPYRVNEKTLMICASYSGNTEETVSAMHDWLAKWAQMLALTSGGILADFCESWGHTCAQMPTGIEPRAALPWSFGIQLAIFEKLWFLDAVQKDLKRFGDWTQTHSAKVILQAQKIAEQLYQWIPFVYTTTGYEAVALRAEQQFQENSRMLAHHHILPEQNHNELLGWQEGNEHVDVLRLIDPDAYERNMKRIVLTKQVLDERKVKQLEIVLQWPSMLTKIISWIYQVDWLSYELAIKTGVDPSGMEIIENLKNALRR